MEFRLMTSLRKRSSLLIRCLIVLMACGCAALLEYSRPPLLERIDESIRDVSLRFFAGTAQEKRIAIVDIDEESLRQVGAWPWSREQLAELVEKLISHHGARSVALDIVLPEPGSPSGDTRLAMLAEHGPLVLSQILDYAPRQPALAQGELSGGDPGIPIPGSPVAHGFIGNHPGLARARCSGNIGYIPDPDGVLRHLPLLSHFSGRNYPHLSVRLLDCTGIQTPASMLQGNVRGYWRIPYHVSFAAYPVISAEAIFKGAVPPDFLRDRHVIVGASSISLGDRVSTPLAPFVAGFMVHAASLSGLLDLEAGKISPPWSGRLFLLGWVFATATLIMLSFGRMRAANSVFLLLSCATAWTLIALVGAHQQAEWSISAPLVAYLVLLLLGLPLEVLLAQNKTRQIINTLSHYVSRQVLNELLRSGQQHSLQPKLREITVLIADIENYTHLTSTLTLHDAAQLTKDVLECLTQPLLALGGTLDKYSGDGLVGFWGAPLDCPDQADIAVDAALTMLRQINMYNERSQSRLPAVRVRIGIESGHALVGDLGTTFRSTYTAVGDCINFSSRLEAAARNMPIPLLIGPETQKRLKRHATHAAGTIKLRGTATEFETYSVPRI